MALRRECDLFGGLFMDMRLLTVQPPIDGQHSDCFILGRLVYIF